MKINHNFNTINNGENIDELPARSIDNIENNNHSKQEPECKASHPSIPQTVFDSGFRLDKIIEKDMRINIKQRRRRRKRVLHVIRQHEKVVLHRHHRSPAHQLRNSHPFWVGMFQLGNNSKPLLPVSDYQSGVAKPLCKLLLQ